MSIALPKVIESRLVAALEPSFVEVVDDSARHAGHAGAASGGGHYNLRVVSARFEGLTRIARHRLVYHALSDLMPEAIHALAIDAQTAEEAARASTAETRRPPS